MSNLAKTITMLTSGNDSQALLAADNLIEKGVKVIPALSEVVTSENSDIRWWGYRTLSGISHPNSIKLLINGLADNNIEVQKCAALGLRSNPDEQAIPPLIGLLSNHDALLSRLAGDSLIAIGPVATSLLIQYVEITPPNERGLVEAVRALATIKDWGAISSLFKLLQSDSALVEHWANQGLENMGVGMMFFDPQ
jgi:HEAT repeat protein